MAQVQEGRQAALPAALETERPKGTTSFGSASLGRLKEAARILAPFGVLAVIWWVIKASFDISDNVLVSPWAVITATVELVRVGILTDFIGLSIQRLGGATLIAVFTAVPIGIVLGLNKNVATAFEPFFRFLQNVSGIAWLPLAVVWYGLSNTTILLVIIYTLTLPLGFNTMLGIKTVPPRYAQMCNSLGASRLRVLRDVYIPGALPNIIVGFRLGIGYGWRALIAGEMLAAQGGLGDMIFQARTANLIDQIMAGMIVIGCLYLVMDRLILQPIEDVTVGRWGVLRS
ncbi:MAG: ABC transporter permease subunit [Actinobacteria bacterium]|nr:ABC transporter permease subunit [Actinomycetota bacterium]